MTRRQPCPVLLYSEPDTSVVFCISSGGVSGGKGTAMEEKMMCGSLENAVARLLAAFPQSLHTERVSLKEALGRITAEDFYAPIHQPPFDRSPLDGYAVRAADTILATLGTPAVLRVVGETLAGMPPARPILPGEAVRIMTGAPIPQGADCVVRQEDTDEGMDKVQVYVSHLPFQNYCHQGEDIRKGTLALPGQTRLDAAAIGVLAMLGQGEVCVLARPKVGLLTTGDELVETGQTLSAGKICNSNQYLLSARLRELDALPQVLPCRGDDVKMIGEAVNRALEDSPFLITTGGVSVGKRDLMPEVCRFLKGELLFHGIPMKPGAPALAFRHRGGLVLCLSGNPFAASATFELLACPVLQRLQGLPDWPLPRIAAILQDPFPKASPVRRFLRGCFRNGEVSLPEGGTDVHASGMLTSMLGCNCLIDIPAGSGSLSAGQRVDVIPLAPSGKAVCGPTESIRETSLRGAPPVIAVSGVKNSGKTTFLEKLLPVLRERGYHAAVIKHDGHDFTPDIPGTDSFRFSAAGAKSVAVFSSLRLMTVSETTRASVEDLVQLFKGVDVILLEGMKDSLYPKLEVIRSEVSNQSVCAPHTLLALVTDTGLDIEGVPSLNLDDIGSAASVVEQYIAAWREGGKRS